MAILSIREYEHLALLAGGGIPVGQEPRIAAHSVAIGGASQQSAAFGERAKFVRLFCDVACSVEFGSNPTATATTCPMAAGQTEYFGVAAGTKVAVIAT